ncbi:MBL fold metallo-hydrolase [Paenibacillus sp. 1P07SE]|uniref:MBL fold metallo-hydrolase n=1 Tax=Paenibacillus sp. 1P07SE TaxID=3132209 RepID=UPI0039A59BF4
MIERIELEVWGGAGEHGRSCYRLEAGGISVLLDCGGKKESGGRYPRIVPERAAQLGAVFLSHAHEDHMAALPLLLRWGYDGEVWLTRETYLQLPGYAKAWRAYAEGRGAAVPYEASDWERLRYRFLDEEAPSGSWLTVASGLRVCWGPSGHLPGAVWLLLDIAGRLAFFSGDYSSESPLLQATLPDARLFGGRVLELAILDAAYGDAAGSQALHLQELAGKLAEVKARGGHALLPVPLRGRGMELLVELTERLPQFPLAAETALAEEWARLLRSAPVTGWLRPGAAERLAHALHRIRQVGSAAARRRLLADEPHIILSPDGMMLAEPARTYGRLLQGEARHAVLFTGHLSIDARAAQPGPVSQLQACEIACFRYKVHQGLPDVLAMLAALQPQRTLLVHTGADATARLIRRLAPLADTGWIEVRPADPLERASSG